MADQMQNRKNSKQDRRKRLLIGGVATVAVLGAAGGIYYAATHSGDDEVTYRESTVSYGELTVGITEDGSVSVGTNQQTFDLDLSAYTSSSSSSSGGGMGGMGGGMPGMMGDMGGSSDDRSLTVESVLVSEGQEIAAGDAILRLDADDIESIRNDLTEDVTNAQLDLAKAQTSETTSNSTAEINKELWSTYGEYAQAEYDSTVSDLEDAVETAQELVDSDEEQLQSLNEELLEDQQDLEDAQDLLDNAEYARDTTSREGTSIYQWVLAENDREDAQERVDDLEDNIEDLEDQITEMQATLEEDQRSLNAAQKALATGKQTAESEYQTQMIQYNNASNYYSLSTAQSGLNVEIAQTEYDEAVDKLDQFDAAIQDAQIVSEYSGIIESVNVADGDTITTKSVILTVNNYKDTEIVVSVDSDDIKQIAEGDSCRVYIDSYPDTDFTATISEIGDSNYNSSTGETTYEVTVTIDDADSGLYNGMSAEVTFVTKETREVLYISNRAVIRENGKSYVYVKGEDGSPIKTEITTGFSDGSNVEVTEGLTEGQTILIES